MMMMMGSRSGSSTFSVAGIAAVMDLNFVSGAAVINGVSSGIASVLGCARVGVANYIDANGLLVPVSANTLRVGTAGLLTEAGATNIALWCRDLTNAAWVKVNATAALTQTGIDGTANSASLLTATSAGATCLQTVVLASSTRAQSAYVKRVTGSGTINMSTDGVTWTAVTVTANWTRVQLTQAAVTNPVFGFQIATSGDAIAVDFVQNETGTVVTSAITTATVSVQRNADVVTMTGANFSSWYNSTAGTFAWAGTISPQSSIRRLFTASSGASTNRINGAISATNVLNGTSASTGGASAIGSINGATIAATGTAKLVYAYALNDQALSNNGGAVGAQVDTACDLPVGCIQLNIGGSEAPSNFLNEYTTRLSYFNSRLSNANLQTAST